MLSHNTIARHRCHMQENLVRRPDNPYEGETCALVPNNEAIVGTPIASINGSPAHPHGQQQAPGDEVFNDNVTLESEWIAYRLVIKPNVDPTVSYYFSYIYIYIGVRICLFVCVCVSMCLCVLLLLLKNLFKHIIYNKNSIMWIEQYISYIDINNSEYI